MFIPSFFGGVWCISKGVGMNTIRSRYLAVLFFLLPITAHAQIYTCIDKNGRFVTADQIMPECADRPVQELDKNGVLRRDILSPIQLQQQEKDLQKQQQVQSREDDVARQDQALMARYDSEAAITAEYQKENAAIDQRLADNQTAISQATKQWQMAQEEAKKDKPNAIPDELQRRIKDARLAVVAQQKLHAQMQAKKAQQQEQYETTLQKYRALRSAIPAENP